MPTTKKKSTSTKKSASKHTISCFPSDWFDDLNTPILILNEGGKILYGNESFCTLINKSKKECKDFRAMDLMFDELTNRKFLHDLLEVYRGNSIKRHVYKVKFGKKTVNFLLDMSPVFNKKTKTVEYAIGIVLDNDVEKGINRIRNLFNI